MVDTSVFTGLGRRPDERRRAAILAGSVGLHVLVLAAIGLGLLETRREIFVDPDSPIYLRMEPRPLLKGETARPPAAARAAPQTQPLTRPMNSLDASSSAQDEDTPSPPAPRAAAGVSGSGVSAPSEANAWTYTPETTAAAIGRTLRTGTGGCRIMDGHLSAAEQALCDDRFQAGAIAAAHRHPLGARTQTASEQRRNEQFARDGAAALRAYEERRRPLAGGVGIAVASPDCVGGNLLGTCAGAYLPQQYQHPEEAPFGGTAKPK